MPSVIGGQLHHKPQSFELLLGAPGCSGAKISVELERSEVVIDLVAGEQIVDRDEQRVPDRFPGQMPAQLAKWPAVGK